MAALTKKVKTVCVKGEIQQVWKCPVMRGIGGETSRRRISASKTRTMEFTRPGVSRVLGRPPDQIRSFDGLSRICIDARAMEQVTGSLHLANFRS